MFKKCVWSGNWVESMRAVPVLLPIETRYQPGRDNACLVPNQMRANY